MAERIVRDKIREYLDFTSIEVKEKVVNLNRVAKVVKGGRIFRFSALVIVGDENGHVGCGTGKAAEILDAIRKAIENAKRNMITVHLVGGTIPHEVLGISGAGKVLLKPAKPGTGVMAGSSVRAVLELAGIKDIRTKCLRSNNPHNVVNATMSALNSVFDPNEVFALRGVDTHYVLDNTSST